MTRIICEPCIDVKSGECVDVCPVDCIHDAGDANMLYIVPDECIDCGACESVCPVTAIFPEEEVPEQWKNYIDMNKQFAAEKRGL